MGEKKFAVEIRKTEAVEDLFKQVDLVLKNHNILPESTSESAENLTVAHVLHRMIHDGDHFFIQTIQRCATICHITISADRILIYKSIDCMQWGAMTPEYRKVIVAMVLDDFREVLNPKK